VAFARLLVFEIFIRYSLENFLSLRDQRSLLAQSSKVIQSAVNSSRPGLKLGQVGQAELLNKLGQVGFQVGTWPGWKRGLKLGQVVGQGLEAGHVVPRHAVRVNMQIRVS